MRGRRTLPCAEQSHVGTVQEPQRTFLASELLPQSETMLVELALTEIVKAQQGGFRNTRPPGHTREEVQAAVGPGEQCQRAA